jgi:hypothetical protein
LKSVVIEVCGTMLLDVYTDDPTLSVMVIDWDTEGHEPGDCYVHNVKDGDQERLVLVVPGYPTLLLDKMPESTRQAVLQTANDLLTPPSTHDTDRCTRRIG